MKQFQNTAIFLLLFLLFIGKDAIVNFSRKLQQEPQLDESLNISYQNLLEKYQAINKYLEIEPEQEETHIPSKVLFRDPFNFFGVITIEKGALDGIKENDAVIDASGLLGVVTATTDHTSKVKLLTNKESIISVKCQDTFGILETNEKKETWIKNLTKET